MEFCLIFFLIPVRKKPLNILDMDTLSGKDQKTAKIEILRDKLFTPRFIWDEKICFVSSEMKETQKQSIVKKSKSGSEAATPTKIPMNRQAAGGEKQCHPSWGNSQSSASSGPGPSSQLRAPMSQMKSSTLYGSSSSSSTVSVSMDTTGSSSTMLASRDATLVPQVAPDRDGESFFKSLVDTTSEKGAVSQGAHSNQTARSVSSTSSVSASPGNSRHPQGAQQRMSAPRSTQQQSNSQRQSGDRHNRDKSTTSKQPSSQQLLHQSQQQSSQPVGVLQQRQGYSSSQHSLPSVQQDYPSTQQGYPTTQQGYTSTPGYPVTQQGYQSTQQGHPSTQQGYPNIQQGYSGYSTQHGSHGYPSAQQTLQGYPHVQQQASQGYASTPQEFTGTQQFASSQPWQGGHGGQTQQSSLPKILPQSSAGSWNSQQSIELNNTMFTQGMSAAQPKKDVFDFFS